MILINIMIRLITKSPSFIKPLPRARRSAGSFDVHHYYFHFSDEETEAWRDEPFNQTHTDCRWEAWKRVCQAKGTTGANDYRDFFSSLPTPTFIHSTLTEHLL